LTFCPWLRSGPLERFRADGEPSDGDWRLGAPGDEMGRRTFAEEFADLTKPTHGECDDDCWCHEWPEEAARCLEERAAHAHH
jgi:hypothetical protein